MAGAARLRQVLSLPLCGVSGTGGLQQGPAAEGVGAGDQAAGGDACLSLQYLHARDPGVSIRWQVVDRRIPLYANHKTVLQKAAALFGAHY